jgi:hypothetical protein
VVEHLYPSGSYFCHPMRILVSKILTILLLCSFTTEITVSAFTTENFYVLAESGNPEEKKEEQKTEKEESEDKISSGTILYKCEYVPVNIFLRNHFIKTSAFKSLPDIPPDKA